MTLALLAATVLVACGAPAPDATGAEEAADTTEHTVTEGALLLTAVDGAMVPGGPVVQAAAAAERALTVYTPARCVTATPMGATVTYTFTNCQGPRGINHLGGSLTVRYGLTAGALTAHATSTGLRVDGAVFNLDADVTHTATADGFSLTVQSRSAGIGPRGVRLGRLGTYTARWESIPQCLTLDGTWETSVAARHATTRVVGLRRCGEHCPQPGGTVDYSADAQGESVSLMFPGGANALWSTSTHRTGTLALTCTN